MESAVLQVHGTANPPDCSGQGLYNSLYDDSRTEEENVPPSRMLQDLVGTPIEAQWAPTQDPDDWQRAHIEGFQRDGYVVRFELWPTATFVRDHVRPLAAGDACPVCRGEEGDCPPCDAQNCDEHCDDARLQEMPVCEAAVPASVATGVQYEVPTPFVVLSRPRSGTHFLRDLLNAHPDIRSYGELFSDCRYGYSKLVVKESNHPPIKKWTAENGCEARHGAPGDAAFLDRLWQGQKHPAVGFKLLESSNPKQGLETKDESGRDIPVRNGVVMQMERDRQEELFFKNPNIKLIVLVRGNPVDMWISMRSASVNHAFAPGQTYTQKGLHIWKGLGPECRKDEESGKKTIVSKSDASWDQGDCPTNQNSGSLMGWAETNYNTWDWIVAMLQKYNREALFLDYEQLSDPHYTKMHMYSISRHLGVRADSDIMDRYSHDKLPYTLWDAKHNRTRVKQTPDGVTQRDKIANYDELKGWLRNTTYLRYLIS